MSKAIELLKKLADENQWEKTKSGYWVWSGTQPSVMAQRVLTLLDIENKQQADFLSLAKEEMDSLEAENEQIKELNKEISKLQAENKRLKGLLEQIRLVVNI